MVQNGSAPKHLASVMVVSFLYSFVIFEPLLGITTLARDRKAEDRLTKSIQSFVLPCRFGRIAGGEYRNPERLIIYVQDLHCNPEVQSNIYEIIKLFDTRYGLNRIMVEGAPAGRVDTGLLSSIPGRKLREKALGNLLSKGLLSGPEYYSAVHDSDKLYGLEEWNVYLSNFARIRNLLREKDRNLETARRLDRILEGQKNRHLSSVPKRLERRLLQKSGTRSFKRYLRLARAGEMAGENAASYSNLSQYIAMAKLNREIHFNRLPEELRHYVKDLKKVLPYRLYAALLKMLEDSNRTEDFYPLLSSIAMEYTPRLADQYPNLSRYFSFIRLNYSMNPMLLIAEEQAYLGRILRKSAGTLMDRELLFLSQMGQQLLHFVQLRMTAEEFDYFREHAGEFRVLLQKYIPFDELRDTLRILDENELFAFYETNIARNDAFVRNIAGNEAAPAPEAGRSGYRAVLAHLEEFGAIELAVTGGFHSDIAHSLKDASYIIITPNVTKHYDETVYDKVLEGTVTLRDIAVSAFAPKLASVLAEDPTPEIRLLAGAIAGAIGGEGGLTLETAASAIDAWFCRLASRRPDLENRMSVAANEGELLVRMDETEFHFVIENGRLTDVHETSVQTASPQPGYRRSPVNRQSKLKSAIARAQNEGLRVYRGVASLIAIKGGEAETNVGRSTSSARETATDGSLHHEPADYDARLRRLTDKLFEILSEHPRAGVFLPRVLARALGTLGLLKAQDRFTYATPGQHYLVYPSYILKAHVRRIVALYMKARTLKAERTIRVLDKQIRALNAEIRKSLRREGIFNKESLLRAQTLQQEREAIRRQLLDESLQIQGRVLDDLANRLRLRIPDSPDNAHGSLASALQGVAASMKDGDEENLSKAISALARQLRSAEEELHGIVKSHRIGFQGIYVAERLMSEFRTRADALKDSGFDGDGAKYYVNRAARLEQYIHQERVLALIRQIEAEKDLIIPEAFQRSGTALRYELLTKFMQLGVAGSFTLLPYITLYGVLGIPLLPVPVMLWIAIATPLTYYITWFPVNKIMLFFIGLYIKVPGHAYRSDIISHIERTYSEAHPLRIELLIPKVSSSESDADTYFFYLRKSLAAVIPTLTKIGNRVELIVTFSSDTRDNGIMAYEIEQLRNIGREYPLDNLLLMYVNKAGCEWYDNTGAGAPGMHTGMFGKKAGGVANYIHFICSGESAPVLWTDSTYEHSQNPQKPIFRRVWSNNLLRVLRVSDTEDEALRKIYAGKKLELHEDTTPEFMILLDDKNQLYAGELEKALSILLHPDNSHIVIGSPHITVTPPYEQGMPKTSTWLNIMMNLRNIYGEYSTKTLSCLFSRQVAFFGKGILRPGLYDRRICRRETLSPARIDSHDFQEAIFSESCEGLYGSNDFSAEILRQSGSEALIRIRCAGQAQFVKIRKGPEGVAVYHLDAVRGDFTLFRTFSFQDILHHMAPEELLDAIVVNRRTRIRLLSEVYSGRDVETEKKRIIAMHGDSITFHTITEYVSGYYGNSVKIGEREHINFVAYLIRVARWLYGDFQVARTLLPYREMLTPYHNRHLTELIRNFFGSPAFAAFIVLVNSNWIFPTVFAATPFTPVAVVSLVAAIFGIIILDRYIDPVRHLFLKARASGGKPRFLNLMVSSLYQIGQGTWETVLIMLVSMQMTVVGSALVLRVYLSERRNNRPEWTPSTVVSLKELQEPVNRKELRDIRTWLQGRGVGRRQFAELYRLLHIVGVSAKSTGPELSEKYLVLKQEMFSQGISEDEFTGIETALTKGITPKEYRDMQIITARLAGLAFLSLSLALFSVGIASANTLLGGMGLLPLFLSLLFGSNAIRTTSRKEIFRPPSGSFLRKAVVSFVMIALLSGSTAGFYKLSSSPLRNEPAVVFLAGPNKDLLRMKADEQKSMKLLRTLMMSPEFTVIKPPLESQPVVNLRPPVTVRRPDIAEFRGLPPEKIPEIRHHEYQDKLPEILALPLDSQIPGMRPKRDFSVARDEAAPDKVGSLTDDKLVHKYIGMQIEKDIQKKSLGQGLAKSAIGMMPALGQVLAIAEKVIAWVNYPKYFKYPWIRWHPSRLVALKEASLLTGLSEEAIVRFLRWDDILKVWGRVPHAKRFLPEMQYELLSIGVLELVGKQNVEPTPDNVQNYLQKRYAGMETLAKEYPHLPIAPYRNVFTRLLHGAREVSKIPFILLRDITFVYPIMPDIKVLSSNAMFAILVYALNIEKEKDRTGDIVSYMSHKNLDHAGVAQKLGLAYINAFWKEGPVGGDEGAIIQLYRDVAHGASGGIFDLKWEDYDDEVKWKILQTEYVIAMDAWNSVKDSSLSRPGARELRETVKLVDTVLCKIMQQDPSKWAIPGLPQTTVIAYLEKLFMIEGVDKKAYLSGDPSTRALYAELWYRTMKTRLLKAVMQILRGEKPHPRFSELARLRYPEAQGQVLDMFAWMILIDYQETYAELQQGHNDFIEKLEFEGKTIQGLKPAPSVSDEQLAETMLFLLHYGPQRYPHIPWEGEYAAEYIAWLIHIRGDTPENFFTVFDKVFQDTNNSILDSPPQHVAQIANYGFFKQTGRTVNDLRVRSFIAWLYAAQRVQTLECNGIRVTPQQAAHELDKILADGQERWKNLPWEKGIANYYLYIKLMQGGDNIWSTFGAQLNATAEFERRGVVPLETFTKVVNARIEDKIHSPILDRRLLQFNAQTAFSDLYHISLAQLLDRPIPWVRSQSPDYLKKYARERVSDKNKREQILAIIGNPETLLARWIDLYQLLKRDYPYLAWDADGNVDYYLIVSLKQGWDLHTTARRFQREWTSANSLADKWMPAFTDIQQRDKAKRRLTQAERNILEFVNQMNRRIEEKTRSSVDNSKSRSHNAVVALASIVIALENEGFKDVNSEALAREWSGVYQAMVARGKDFPWTKGGIVDSYLMIMKLMQWDVQGLDSAFGDTWAKAGELVKQSIDKRIPVAYISQVNKQFAQALKKRIQAHRKKSGDPRPVTNEEVSIDDPEQRNLNAVIALASALSDAGRSYPRITFEPLTLAGRISRYWNEGPRLFPSIPWHAEGFSESFAAAGYALADPWKMAEILFIGDINGNFDLKLDSRIEDETRHIMLAETGRMPRNEDIVHFQTVHDGIAIAQSYGIPVTAESIARLLSLRHEIRSLDALFPFLNLTERGRSERWTALAYKENIPAVELRRKYFEVMAGLYPQIRSVFSEDDLALYKGKLVEDALRNNEMLARLSGIGAELLFMPEISDDDIIVDTAFYHILRARTVSRKLAEDGLMERLEFSGEDQLSDYLRDSFFPLFKALKACNQERLNTKLRSSAVDQQWTIIEEWHGKLDSQTFAFLLLDRIVFSSSDRGRKDSAFSRFESFDVFFREFLRNAEEINSIPEIREMLAALKTEDDFLADGLEFSLTVWKTVKGVPIERARMIAARLPEVIQDYRTILRWVPRPESGTSFYDAVITSFYGGNGISELIRRLDFSKRTIYRWDQIQILKAAYRILFDRILDEDDPEQGSEVKRFIEQTLPLRLEKATGGRNLKDWVRYLLENGEINLQGNLTGYSFYNDRLTKLQHAPEGSVRYWENEIERLKREHKDASSADEQLKHVRKRYQSHYNLVFEPERGLLAMAEKAQQAKGINEREIRDAVLEILALFGILAFAVASGAIISRRRGAVLSLLALLALLADNPPLDSVGERTEIHEPAFVLRLKNIWRNGNHTTVEQAVIDINKRYGTALKARKLMRIHEPEILKERARQLSHYGVPITYATITQNPALIVWRKSFIEKTGGTAPADPSLYTARKRFVAFMRLFFKTKTEVSVIFDPEVIRDYHEETLFEFAYEMTQSVRNQANHAWTIHIQMHPGSEAITIDEKAGRINLNLMNVPIGMAKNREALISRISGEISGGTVHVEARSSLFAAVLSFAAACVSLSLLGTALLVFGWLPAAMLEMLFLVIVAVAGSALPDLLETPLKLLTAVYPAAGAFLLASQARHIEHAKHIAYLVRSGKIRGPDIRDIEIFKESLGYLGARHGFRVAFDLKDDEPIALVRGREVDKRIIHVDPIAFLHLPPYVQTSILQDHEATHFQSPSERLAYTRQMLEAPSRLFSHVAKRIIVFALLAAQLLGITACATNSTVTRNAAPMVTAGLNQQLIDELSNDYKRFRSRKVPKFYQLHDEQSKWYDRVLKERVYSDPNELKRGIINWNHATFRWSETEPVTGKRNEYVLHLPQYREPVNNDKVSAQWSRYLNTFDFGVGNLKTFGHVFTTRDGNESVSTLNRLTHAEGINPQDFEYVSEVFHTDLNLHEHKGLIPGLPVSFQRFTFFNRKTAVTETVSPAPAPGYRIRLSLGATPIDNDAWEHVEMFDVGNFRVLFGSDGRDRYFMALPQEDCSGSYIGDIPEDFVVIPDKANTIAQAGKKEAGVFFLSNVMEATVFAGKVSHKDEIAGYLMKAQESLKAYDDAKRDLRQNGPDGKRFFKYFVDTILKTHISRRYPGAIDEIPYGSHGAPRNVSLWSANNWLGSDAGDWLAALNMYYRKTGDTDALQALKDLTDWSLQYQTPSGSVYMKLGHAMILAPESDENTGRNDVFIDNSLASVCFNHLNLVIRRGYERIAGFTWGAVEPVINGSGERVDNGKYYFSIDENSIPDTYAVDQPALSVSRNFTKTDGSLLIKEHATVQQGTPAAKIGYEIINTGAKPVHLNEVRVNIGDYLAYGSGVNEMHVNRYGLSSVIEDVRLPVRFSMEHSDEVLMGSNFPYGWVDFTEMYRSLRPRYILLYAYDRAAAFYLPDEVEGMSLYHPDPKEEETLNNYDGWTKIQIRFKQPQAQVLKPGETYATPPVHTYVFWVPLISDDADMVPDELEYLAPLWADSLEQSHQGKIPDRNADVSNLSLETDYAYAGMIWGWIESVKTLRQDGDQKGHRRARQAALKGINFTLRAWKKLREHYDLMPSFGIMRYYGFHVALFDWAYGETGDIRYLDAMKDIAETILKLQIIDPAKPNYGAFVINEFSSEAGANNLDDQGIKLWALRIAYDRTRDTRYLRSAELLIHNWIKIRPDNCHFWGVSKNFDKPDPEGRYPDGYRETGLEQQMTPYGHFTLLFGVKNWLDVFPRAAELYKKGTAYAARRNMVEHVGLAGMRYMVFPEKGSYHLDTNTETNAAFLRSLMFQQERPARAPEEAVRNRKADRPGSILYDYHHDAMRRPQEKGGVSIFRRVVSALGEPLVGASSWEGIAFWLVPGGIASYLYGRSISGLLATHPAELGMVSGAIIACFAATHVVVKLLRELRKPDGNITYHLKDAAGEFLKFLFPGVLFTGAYLFFGSLISSSVASHGAALAGNVLVHGLYNYAKLRGGLPGYLPTASIVKQTGIEQKTGTGIKAIRQHVTRLVRPQDGVARITRILAKHEGKRPEDAGSAGGLSPIIVSSGKAPFQRNNVTHAGLYSQGLLLEFYADRVGYRTLSPEPQAPNLLSIVVEVNGEKTYVAAELYYRHLPAEDGRPRITAIGVKPVTCPVSHSARANTVAQEIADNLQNRESSVLSKTAAAFLIKTAQAISEEQNDGGRFSAAFKRLGLGRPIRLGLVMKSLETKTAFQETVGKWPSREHAEPLWVLWDGLSLNESVINLLSERLETPVNDVTRVALKTDTALSFGTMTDLAGLGRIAARERVSAMISGFALSADECPGAPGFDPRVLDWVSVVDDILQERSLNSQLNEDDILALTAARMKLEELQRGSQQILDGHALHELQQIIDSFIGIVAKAGYEVRATEALSREEKQQASRYLGMRVRKPGERKDDLVQLIGIAQLKKVTESLNSRGIAFIADLGKIDIDNVNLQEFARTARVFLTFADGIEVDLTACSGKESGLAVFLDELKAVQRDFENSASKRTRRIVRARTRSPILEAMITERALTPVRFDDQTSIWNLGKKGASVEIDAAAAGAKARIEAGLRSGVEEIVLTFNGIRTVTIDNHHEIEVARVRLAGEPGRSLLDIIEWAGSIVPFTKTMTEGSRYLAGIERGALAGHGLSQNEKHILWRTEGRRAAIFAAETIVLDADRSSDYDLIDQAQKIVDAWGIARISVAFSSIHIKLKATEAPDAKRAYAAELVGILRGTAGAALDLNIGIAKKDHSTEQKKASILLLAELGRNLVVDDNGMRVIDALSVPEAMEVLPEILMISCEEERLSIARDMRRRIQEKQQVLLWLKFADALSRSNDPRLWNEMTNDIVSKTGRFIEQSALHNASEEELIYGFNLMLTVGARKGRQFDSKQTRKQLNAYFEALSMRMNRLRMTDASRASQMTMLILTTNIGKLLDTKDIAELAGSLQTRKKLVENSGASAEEKTRALATLLLQEEVSAAAAETVINRRREGLLNALVRENSQGESSLRKHYSRQAVAAAVALLLELPPLIQENDLRDTFEKGAHEGIMEATRQVLTAG